MTQLRAVKDKALSDIRHFIKQAKEEELQALFSKERPWIDQWYKEKFPNEEWAFDSKLNFDKVPLDSDISSDFENAIALHNALSLSRVQAADERLWTYLSLVEYWDYTRQRWELDLDKIKEKSQQTRINERYFVRSTETDRPFLRNALSRLWWAVEVTKDETRENPYELTKIVLGNTDIYLNVMERSFSRNEEVIKGILELLIELGEEVYMPGRFYRQIVKQVNAMGGVVMLDFMTKEDLKAAVKSDLSLIKKSTS
jgi:hypothetical protein